MLWQNYNMCFEEAGRFQSERLGRLGELLELLNLAVKELKWYNESVNDA